MVGQAGGPILFSRPQLRTAAPSQIRAHLCRIRRRGSQSNYRVMGSPPTKLPPNPTAYCYLSDGNPPLGTGSDNGSGFHFWMDASATGVFSACVLVVMD